MSQPSDSSPQLAYRPATLDDWPVIARLVANTWEDGDYIDEAIWQAWASDYQGHLVAATLEGQIVAFARLVELGPAEWWLEGLRVAAERRGQGIGRALLAYMMELFRQRGDGLLRFLTGNQNEVMVHLAGKFGFRHTLSYALMEATPLPADYRRFKLLQPPNFAMVSGYLRRSPVNRVNHFVDRHWALHYLTHERLAQYLDDPAVEVLGWRHHDQLRGLAIVFLARPGQEVKEKDALLIGYLDALDDTSLMAMLAALRGLAAKRSLARISWKMPVGVGLERVVGATELKRSWEGELWLFELPLRR